MKAGTKLLVTQDCVCQGWMHEHLNFPREGFLVGQEKKLTAGEIVTCVGSWGNNYGSYTRVKKSGDDWNYDIDPANLAVATPEQTKWLEQIPRRAKLWLNKPAELAIHKAVGEVEKLGADIKLTEAVVLLGKAKEFVSDYIDEAGELLE